MEINNLDKQKELNLYKNLENGELQKNFLENMLGKTVNTAVDIGIRALLPDFIENQIISIKDNLMNYGLKEGIDKTIKDAIEIGKSAIGLVTGNFENVNQMQNAVKAGGVIDNISSLIDFTLEKANQAGVINNKIFKNIKEGKNIILNNIEKNIEGSFSKQSDAIESIGKNIEEWKKYFNNNDFKGMEKEYKKIEKQIINIVPIEKIINEARKIETLHNLVKNNNGNTNLTKDQLELAEKLV